LERRRKGSGVINVASIAAYQPGPFEATYCATKAFVNSFSQGVHEEVKGSGVTILSLCPGLTRTEFQEKGGGDATSMPKLVSQSAEQVVDSALKAFRRGRAVHIPGAPNKAGALFARVSPQVVGRKVASGVGRRLAKL
jgi:hypothetical protein